MTFALKNTTTYPDVDEMLHLLANDIQRILGDQLIGLYLHGSLAGGDFNPRRSDIDFLAATAGVLEEDILEQLAAMHRQHRSTGLAWAAHIEGSYIPVAALRRYDPDNDRHPALDVDGNFKVQNHGSAWVIQRHILREKGVALIGPPAHTLVDPVSAKALREAQVGTLREWWRPQLSDPWILRTSEYQAYGVLTMCRSLYTLRTGETASKTVTANWALQALDPRWHTLIRESLAWPDGLREDALPEVLELIAYTLNEADAVMEGLDKKPA